MASLRRQLAALEKQIGALKGREQMRVVTTKQATIRTAAVEIKTLSVSGRQVTLSLFRQFPEEHVIDPATCQLRGVPWGRVRYFFGGCERRDPDEHLHVVWQKGDELRRACVEPLTFHEHKEMQGARIVPSRWKAVRGDRFAIAALSGLLPPSCFSDRYTGGSGSWEADDLFLPCPEADALRAGWAARWQELAALDQLYIAV